LKTRKKQEKPTLGGNMIIPEVVRIGSSDYEVEFTDNPIVVDHKECYAAIDYNNHTIEISNQLGDIQTQEQSFLHELFHGIVRDRALEIQDEEFVVDELAKAMHQVIRDNKIMFLDEVDFEMEEEEIDVQTTE